jgi:hypothetical protein
MMQDKQMGENANADWWHTGPAWETVGAWPSLTCCSQCCVQIYIPKNYLQYSLDYQSIKNEKRGDNNLSLYRMVVHELSCDIDVLGKSLGVSGGGQNRSILGVPGLAHAGTLHLLGGSKFDPPGLMHH